MDRATLQTPKSGRSRFSKALPAPPPELEDDRPLTAPREALPSVFSPFPPRKDSVSVKTHVNAATSPSGISNLVNSPLPALPPTNIMATSTLQMQTRTIPRKPVGLPSNPAPQAGAAKSKKMKRVSSISSLLSAYSNTSSDSVQRSSQGSIYTKDSEPSNSPEREGINDSQQSITKTLPVLPSNPYVEEVSSVTDEMIADLPPPPPPLKDPARPRTPSNARSTDPFSAYRSSEQDGVSATSPSSLIGNSPQQREIWRRRASSKDGNILVPELKLAGSHGSTAATSQPANSELIPPPPPVQNSNITSPLPPRNASLPGRNIRPAKQPESQPEPQQEDEMRRLQTKLKELTTRGEGAKDSKDSKDESIKTGEQSKASTPKGQDEVATDAKSTSPTKGQSNAEEPPKIAHTWVDRAAHLYDTPVHDSPTAPSEPAPKESPEKSVSRRPVGAPVTSPQPEVHKKVSSSDLRKQNLGLPRFPRPSQSNSSLRSPAAPQNVQGTVGPNAVAQSTPPAAMPLTLPANSDEPIKKPELFNMVTLLNEPTISPTISPDSTSARKPTRKISRDVNSTNLSDIGESVEHITPEQMERINAALSRFPRGRAGEAAPSSNAIWPSAPISSKHYDCYVRHVRWVPVKNLNYPLTCQTCGLEDTSSRKTCAWCNLRICFKCHERLMGPYKSDLKLLMDNMEHDQREDKRRDKGKQAETA